MTTIDIADLTTITGGTAEPIRSPEPSDIGRLNDWGKKWPPPPSMPLGLQQQNQIYGAQKEMP